jgi:hypothetical protein
MGTAGRVENACFYPVTDDGLAIEGVIRHICIVDEGERIDELLRHPARKIDDFVLPKIAIKTTIGGTVRIAIEKG